MKIGLVSCVKQKRSVPAPAKELYVSPLFKKSRQWAERNCDKWYVLSAKYGLVCPNQVIEPYELTLKSFGAERRRQWAQDVFEVMKQKGLLRAGVKFTWLAGRDYNKELSLLLGAYYQTDPMEGLRMGERLGWLSSQQKESGRKDMFKGR